MNESQKMSRKKTALCQLPGCREQAQVQCGVCGQATFCSLSHGVDDWNLSGSGHSQVQGCVGGATQAATNNPMAVAVSVPASVSGSVGQTSSSSSTTAAATSIVVSPPSPSVSGMPYTQSPEIDRPSTPEGQMIRPRTVPELDQIRRQRRDVEKRGSSLVPRQLAFEDEPDEVKEQ